MGRIYRRPRRARIDRRRRRRLIRALALVLAWASGAGATPNRGSISDVLVHDLVPARFDCPRGVFLVNQRRWFKHMHDRDGGPSDTSTVAGSMRPVRVWVASLVARVNAATSAAAMVCFQTHAGRMHEVSALSKALASRKSGVSKPSVNQLQTGVSRPCASANLPSSLQRRARFVVARNSHHLAR